MPPRAGTLGGPLGRTTSGCENETRSSLKAFEGLQVQPRFFCSSATNCHVSSSRVRLLASSPVVCVRILICVIVRFVLFSTAMLHLSTRAVLRTDCHLASAPVSDRHLWRTSHREKVFHADALRMPVPARSDFAFWTPGIGCRCCLLHYRANRTSEAECERTTRLQRKYCSCGCCDSATASANCEFEPSEVVRRHSPFFFTRSHVLFASRSVV